MAIIAPIALSFAAKHKINPLMMGMMVVHGAQAGGFSPIAVYGVTVNSIIAKTELDANPMAIFLASFLFNLAIALVLFVVLDGGKLLSTPGGRLLEQAAEGACPSAWVPAQPASRCRGPDPTSLPVNVASLHASGLVEHIVDERPDAAEEAQPFCRRLGRAIEYELATLAGVGVNELLPRRLAKYRNLGSVLCTTGQTPPSG